MKKYQIKFYRELMFEVDIYANTQEEALRIFNKTQHNVEDLKPRVSGSYTPTDEIHSVRDISSTDEVTA